MRWWACDSGHSNPIDADAPAVFVTRCPRCPPGLLPYRIERDVDEDNPARLVPAPQGAC